MSAIKHAAQVKLTFEELLRNNNKKTPVWENPITGINQHGKYSHKTTYAQCTLQNKCNNVVYLKEEDTKYGGENCTQLLLCM